MTTHIALNTYLKPLEKFLFDDTISDILINQPYTVFIEQQGLFTQHRVPELSYTHLQGLTNLIARASEQRLSNKEPLLSAMLPTGHRVQIILPPATARERLIISIRKQTVSHMTLDDYEMAGAFTHTRATNVTLRQKPITPEDNALQQLFDARNYARFLKHAIQLKKNILISGATSTGKTTFLNSCLQEIPKHEHIVTIEDVSELKPPHALHTQLLTSKGLQGITHVTIQDLMQASLRIRPDRIILGELRGKEALDFINATATGHDGSLSSLHASSPLTAFMRLTHMVKLSGIPLSRNDILKDLYQLIDVIVQLERRFSDNHYARCVSEIYYADAHSS